MFFTNAINTAPIIIIIIEIIINIMLTLVLAT